jgi:hypothetical protein
MLMKRLFDDLAVAVIVIQRFYFRYPAKPFEGFVVELVHVRKVGIGNYNIRKGLHVS